MSFSAGDIEGTLTLDRSPFIRGLEQARKDAEQFERRRIKATVDADTTGAKRELRTLPRQHDVDVKMHVDQAHRQIQSVLRSLGSVKVAAGASIVALVPAAAAAAAAIGGVSVAALATVPAFGALGAAMAMHVKRGGATITALKHELGHLRGAFENATGPATRRAWAGLTSLIVAFQPVLRGLRGEFTQLGEQVGMAFAAIGEHLQSARMVRFFETMLRGSRQAVAPMTGIFNNLLSVLANITQAAMPMFIRGLERTSEALARMVRHTNDIGRLRDQLDKGARSAGQFWRIARNLGDVLKSVWTAAQQPSADFVGAIERGTEHLARFFRTAEGQDILRKTLESMVFFAEELMRALPTLIQMFGVILDIGRRLWTIVTGILNVIQKIPVVGPTLAAVGLAFAAWMGPIGLVRGALRGVIGLLGTIRRSRVPSPVGGGGGGSTVVAPINTGKATADAAKSGSTAGRAGFIAGLVAAIAAGRARVASVVRGIARTAGQLAGRIPGLGRIAYVIGAGFAAAVPKVRSAVSKIGPMAGNLLRGAGRVVARGVFGWPGLVATAIVTLMPDKLRDALRKVRNTAVSEFISAGAAIARGLASGIASGASAVVSAAVGIAKSAWEAAKRFLRLGSPSRRFREAGMNVSRGFAVGIKDQSAKVIEVAQKLAEDAYRPIREAAQARLAMMDAEDTAREGPPLTRGQREAAIYGRINEARFATDEQGRLLNQPPPGVQWMPSGEEREMWQELADLRRSFEREDLEAAANVTIQALSPSDPRVLREVQRAVGRSVRLNRRRRPSWSRRA